MNRKITAEEEKLLYKHRDRVLTNMPYGKLFEVGKTEINGATFYYNERGAEYTLDDVNDPDGNPYIFPFMEYSNTLENGTRIIAITNGDTLVFMRGHEALDKLIPPSPDRVPGNDSVWLGHPNQLKFNDDSVPDEKERIARFFRVYKSSNAAPRWAVHLGPLFFGLCGWILAVFGLYGFVFQYTPLADKYFMAGLPLIVVLTLLTVIASDLIVTGRMKRKYGSIRSVTKVILMCTFPQNDQAHTRTFHICGMRNGNSANTEGYSHHDSFDCSDAKTMMPGQIIYKYTCDSGKVFLGTR